MKLLTLLFFSALAFGQMDAPSATKEKLLDWQFFAVHSVYAGALAFDLTATSIGVGNGCQEASSNLGPFPSNKKIVATGLIEFGAVVALDLGMKALGRHNGMPKWLSVGGSSVGAGIGTFKHARGGYKWTRTGCL